MRGVRVKRRTEESTKEETGKMRNMIIVSRSH